MPNLVAYLALLAWPLVAILLFRFLTLQKALIWTFLAGHLLLPAATYMKLPTIPPFDKASIPTIAAVVLCLIVGRRSADPLNPGSKFGRGIVYALLALTVGLPLLTTLTNPEPLIYGNFVIPGLTLYDAAGQIEAAALTVLPLWLGLRYLNTRESHITLLQAFVFGALAYSLPALLEIRLSPQLHVWIYGFFPHEFVQHIRAGGFRPMVFLGHGLLVGIFLCKASIAAFVLYREARRERRSSIGWLAAGIWLVAILFLSKNVGAFVVAILLSLVVLFTGRKVQTVLAVVVAAVIILYPMLRSTGAIPVMTIFNITESISDDRAHSYLFRLNNEDALLARTKEKPLFGWGSWGRNQIYDPFSAQMISVTDGTWIILLGASGWVGYLAQFGLLIAPILFFAFGRNPRGPSLVTPGLMIVLCATLIDLIPNSGLVNYVWLIAGSLVGYVLWQPAARLETSGDTAAASNPGAAFASRARASWLMDETPTAPARRDRRKLVP